MNTNQNTNSNDGSSTGETILLVDDDESLTMILARALTRHGFIVVQSHSDLQALQVCEEQTFHKAIVDLKLAESSGLQLIPKLLQIQPKLEIVMLTGYSSIATAVEAIKLGAKNYLCKPADVEEIISSFGGQASPSKVDLASKPPSVDRLEWEHIQRVLQEHDGNISATARALGMHRRTLQRKLQKRPVRE
ncbi:response regulator transcription factor [Aurantivibrio infirmus]